MRSKFKRKIKRKKSFLKNKEFWKSFLIISQFLLISYILFFSSYFKIENIYVKGGENSKNLEETFSSIFLKSNILLSNFSKKITTFLKNHPEISNIKVKRVFPDSVIFIVENRKPEFIVFNNKEKCLLDKNGICFQKIDNKSFSGLIKISVKNENIKLREKILSEKLLNDILFFQSNLKKIGILPDYYIIEDDIIKVKTKNGFFVLFSLSKDKDQQIVELNLIKEKYNFKNLDYIDLRFKRVYLKYKK